MTFRYNKCIFWLWLLLISVIGSSHVGSPGVIYEGMLGPHRILAHVEPPDVIPGIALVTVVLPDNPSGITLEAKPVYWSVGLDGTPVSDPVEPVSGEPGKYQLDLWFMGTGASSVHLTMLDGVERYEVTIPILAMPTAQKDMPVGLGIVLGLLGLFLVILMVTIVTAAMGDSLKHVGQSRDSRFVRRKRLGMLIGTVMMCLLLWVGKTWWDNEAQSYQHNIYKPIQGTATYEVTDEGDFLDLKIDPNELSQGGTSRKMSYLIPDHGKLMHLFLIKKETLDVFAHLHPQRIDSLYFRSKLPDLPVGEYHVFADITRFTGFAETIVSTLDIPDEPKMKFVSEANIWDRDDSFLISSPIGLEKADLLDRDFIVCGKPGVRMGLGNGYEAIWESDVDKYEAGRLYNLTFALFDPTGNPAALQPYLGMMGHAVVMKFDGSVYIHLHPTGNYSMGAQEIMVERFSSGKVGYRDMPSGLGFMDSINHVVKWLDGLPDEERDAMLMSNMVHLPQDTGTHKDHQVVSFPYAFPESGAYRIWVQVKVNGEVMNAAFDVEVD